MIDPFWTHAVIQHLLYGHKKCLDSNDILYQNKVLGWYEFEGVSYYFYDETEFNGKKAQSTRKSIEFQKGDKEVYLQFLRDTVFPSTELSLALAIGYSAVVVSRLNAEEDLGTIIVNLCGTSSTGKSTAEMLMCSPFMNPEISNKNNGLCFTANNTQNAIFARIEGIFGIPFVIDDITTNPNINLTQFIYTLVDGTNKGRLNGNSELREDGLGWSGIAITSSETPILDYGDQYQGTKTRVLHTQGIQWTKSAEESKLVKRTVRKNFGFTGKEFANYVATIPMDELCDRFDDALDIVQTLMVKKDNLTDRLANKYAVIYLTVELLNEAFTYGLSADKLLGRFIQSEQNTFEERDNAIKAYSCVIDFIFRNQSRFIIDQQVEDMLMPISSEYIPSNLYGKIIKYNSQWEVHLLQDLTKKILADNGLVCELRSIRQKWIDRGITKGDVDHNTRQYTHTGVKARYDCFIIKGGIQEPEGEAPTKDETPLPPTPVSDYAVDDTQAINEIFGGENV